MSFQNDVILKKQSLKYLMKIDIDQILQQTITAQNKGKFREAEIGYKKLIELKPDYAEAHNNLAVIRKELGRLDEAEISFKKAIKLKPDYADAHYNLGIILQELNRVDEAEINYKKAIKLKPDYVQAYNNLGNTLKDLERFDEAITYYKKVIELDPKNLIAHNNLGVTLIELSRLDEAELSLKKAIEIKPDFVEPHNNLGLCLAKLAKLDEAEISFKKAIKLKPDYVQAYNNLGNTLKHLERFDEAATYYKKVIELDPNHDEAKHLLASVTGKTTNSAPRSYVENLFNNYASTFEESLSDNLEYEIPKIITEMIIAKNLKGSLGSILDLGCGTGLTGVQVKKFCTNLEGVDLSKLMLAQARKKNIYDKLIHKDIIEYLSTEKLDFNYFIATDVFIYVGDISDVFRLIKSRNKLNGRLVFSTEHTDKDRFFLEKSGRYSHSKKYIESLCKEFNFNLSHFEKIKLRKEKDFFIMGSLYLLDF